MESLKPFEVISQKIEGIFLKKSPYTWVHSLNVSRIASIIAKDLDLDEEDIKIVEIGGLLHDIGKIHIPTRILNKPSRLTEEEYLIIKSHPVLGLKEFKRIMPSPILQKVLQIVLFHHERYDGNGYSFNLREEEIPLLSRIVSVADVIDAIYGIRPYKNSLSKKEVINELENAKYTQLDSSIVDIALLNIDEILEGYNSNHYNQNILISIIG